MLFPAIPEIIKDFKIDYSTSSWILSGYLITAAVMAPIAGKFFIREMELKRKYRENTSKSYDQDYKEEIKYEIKENK